MEEKNIRLLTQEKLHIFMHEFDATNRNNRLSKELISGFAGFLENFIVELITEIQQKEVSEKQ